MNWHLRGQYLTFESGKQLAFTWKWDHDVEGEQGREVALTFAPILPTGTMLRLVHSPYTNSADDQKLRLEHHLAGWLHFLPRLLQIAIEQGEYERYLL
jgi:uncharacterized protein YndB with AHSA1/START domain